MGFSFNWAGVNIPQIQVKDTTENAMRDAANLGAAVRGYEVKKANKEYAGLISSRNEALTKMDEISNRIASLQRRNEEIKAELAGMQQQAVQPNEPAPTFVSTPEQPTPMAYPYSNNLGG